MQLSGQSANNSPKLPALRRDVRFEFTNADAVGRSLTTIVDPVRAAYFRLQWPESGVLPLWKSCSTVAEVCDRARDQLQIVLSESDVAGIAAFLHQNQLTETDASGSWRQYHAQAMAGQHSWTTRLIHNYLFFRIPLLHPQKALLALLPYLSFIFSRGFALAYLATITLAGYLISRQWGEFEAMFSQVSKLPSLTVFAVVLLMLKALHELGHALTTVRADCRVGSMGVAFMLGAPVLYTDTTDSWRLPARSQRLAIVIAGVAAEMIVAGIAALFWPFLPDGMGRQICFAILTSSIVTSLLINLNPFMRFDGYFALSDYLDVPNLQPRAFALARWKMREIFFSLGEPAPETFAPRMRKILVAYAWTTWLYRVMLFAGIAAVVYAMFPKALGICLALFEVIVFIARPIAAELKEWWDMRSNLVNRRLQPAALLAICAVAMMFAPWMHVIDSPAVLFAGNEEPLHVSAPARITQVHVVEGKLVNAGDLLFRAESPDLQLKAAQARLELRALEIQSAQLPSMQKEREKILIVRQEIGRAREKMASLDRLQQKLEIRAPFAGTIVDLDTGVRPGVWQNPSRPLARLIASNQTRARGIVRDTDLSRIAVGASAVFVPEDTGTPSRPMQLASIAAASTNHISEPVLADNYGGPVATIDEHGEQLARYGGFEVAFVSADPAPPSVIRGTVRIQASSTSPFMLAWRQVARVLIREQGF